MSELEKAREYFSGDKYAVDATDIVIEAVGDNYARCSFKITEKHKNARGFVMGGAMFTLADFTFAVAANTGKPYATVTNNANISYLEAARGEYLKAETRLIRDGKRTCLFEIEIRDDRDVLVALVMASGMHLI